MRKRSSDGTTPWSSARLSSPFEPPCRGGVTCSTSKGKLKMAWERCNTHNDALHAEQRSPVKRLVALKLIKAGMDSKMVLARFEAERQALALMDHPNIARILDGGITESGSPYFVMELVKGVPITEYCDAKKLTPQQRLELFVPVCHAIQHAHQKRDHSPRHQAIERDDLVVRRQSSSQSHRLRRSQSHRPSADRTRVSII